MIIVDYQSKTPLYEQIVDRFQLLILKGVLKADDKIPSVRSLAVSLSINPNTIQKAYTTLEQSGYIYSVKGRGNFVAKTKDVKEQEKDKFTSDLKELLKYGRDIGITKEECISFIDEIFDKGGLTNWSDLKM